MRDKKRIDEFCKALAENWHRVPDWRFGQLISNIYAGQTRDIFFIEDDEMQALIESYFEN
jgi:hypothetical protein